MNTRLRIGPAEVLPLTRQVFVDGVEQRLGGRAFDLLMALARQPDGIVSKESLYEAVWQDCAVEPNNLQVQMWALRRLLGAHAITTVPRRGYRLALPVQRLPSPLPWRSPAVDEGVRAWLAEVQQRWLTLRWVTLVAPQVEVRQRARELVQQQLLNVAVWQWRGPHAEDADAALWRRVSAGDGVILAEDLTESAAAALHERHRQAQASPRILATSAQPLRIVAETVWDVSGMTALSSSATGENVACRTRTGLVRRGTDSLF